MEAGSMSELPMHVDVVTVHRSDKRIGAGETIPRWSTSSRLALGAMTFAMPVIATVLATWSLAYPVDPPPVLLGAVFGFMITHCLVTLFYVAFAAQNPRLRSHLRWQLALVLAGPITIPAYWLIHVWGAPRISSGGLDADVPDVEMSERGARAHALAHASPA
jgi:hypothetical protein